MRMQNKWIAHEFTDAQGKEQRPWKSYKLFIHSVLPGKHNVYRSKDQLYPEVWLVEAKRYKKCRIEDDQFQFFTKFVLLYDFVWNFSKDVLKFRSLRIKAETDVKADQDFHYKIPTSVRTALYCELSTLRWVKCAVTKWFLENCPKTIGDLGKAQCMDEKLH